MNISRRHCLNLPIAGRMPGARVAVMAGVFRGTDRDDPGGRALAP